MSATQFYLQWKVNKASKALSESKTTEQRAAAIVTLAKLWARRGQ